MILTVQDHAEQIRKCGIFWQVFLNGVDVTSRCWEAENGPDGWADCYLLNSEGKRCVEIMPCGERRPAHERLHGNVEFRPRPATKEEMDCAEVA